MTTIKENGVSNKKDVEEIVMTEIYPNLTEYQKEYISKEMCVEVYKNFEFIVENVLVVEDFKTNELGYNPKPIAEITERFLRCVKAIKRGSVYYSWCLDPNFINNDEDNRKALKLKEVVGQVRDFDDIYEENKVGMNGRNKRNVAVNVVFNLIVSCETKDYYKKISIEDTIDRIELSIVTVAKMLKKIGTKGKVNQ